MKKNIFIICMAMAAGCITTLTAQVKNAETLVPLTKRVNVQADTARLDQIIDGCWVAVGTNKKHAIQRDFTRLFAGKPSYRFELRKEDNTLEGYGKGETKGRAEFSYCYATSADFKGLPADAYRKAQITKTVYHHGKVFVRKEFHAIMSFLCIFHLLWIVMSPRFLPSGMVCPTARLCRLPKVK